MNQFVQSVPLQIDMKFVAEVRKSRPSPIVSIIGSASPNDKDYSPLTSMLVGQAVHEFSIARNGSFMTGGVGGVGLDAFAGAALNKMRSTLKNCPLNFFTVIPYEVMVPASMMDDDFGEEHGSSFKMVSVPYSQPYGYSQIFNSLDMETDIVQAGRDMDERRAYLANIADVLVFVNGGSGTLDEAITALQANKPVIAIEGSGGYASKMINAGVEGRMIPFLAKHIGKSAAKKVPVNLFSSVPVSRLLDELNKVVRD